jgi:drug/metabolite transporter superfamily protein YnfA
MLVSPAEKRRIGKALLAFGVALFVINVFVWTVFHHGQLPATSGFTGSASMALSGLSPMRRRR